MYDIDALSTLLALCVGNPSVTDGLPPQKTNNAEHWCFVVSMNMLGINTQVASDLRHPDAHVMSL